MAATSDEGSIDQQLEQLARAAEHLDAQTQRMLDAISNLSMMTYVAWIAVGLIVLVGLIGWRWIAHLFAADLDRHKIALQEQADSRLQQLGELIQKNVDSNKAALDRIAALGQSLLNSAQSVDTDLRQRRERFYLLLWQITRVLPQWPLDNVPYRKIKETSKRMRRWYFAGGGMYLSTEAMASYRMLQEALSVFGDAKDDGLLDKQEYADLRGYMSRMRTRLTLDLFSRNAPLESTLAALSAVDRAGPQAAENPEGDADHDAQGEFMRQTGRLTQLLAIGDVEVTIADGRINVSGKSGPGVSEIILKLSTVYAKFPAQPPLPSQLLADQEVSKLNLKKKPPLDTIDVRAVFRKLNRLLGPVETTSKPLPPPAATV